MLFHLIQRGYHTFLADSIMGYIKNVAIKAIVASFLLSNFRAWDDDSLAQDAAKCLEDPT
jgi:hypothetical protein